MPFPKKQLAPLVKFRKTQKAQGKPWPPVPKDAPVTRWSAWMSSAGSVPIAARVDPIADAAGFIYTGGTTGLSKGAMLSHRNLVANAMQGATYLSIGEANEGLLGSLPFFHSFGMLVMNVAILRAGKLVPDPEPARPPPRDGGDRRRRSRPSCRASPGSSTRSTSLRSSPSSTCGR